MCLVKKRRPCFEVEIPMTKLVLRLYLLVDNTYVFIISLPKHLYKSDVFVFCYFLITTVFWIHYEFDFIVDGTPFWNSMKYLKIRGNQQIVANNDVLTSYL